MGRMRKGPVIGAWLNGLQTHEKISLTIFYSCTEIYEMFLEDVGALVTLQSFTKFLNKFANEIHTNIKKRERRTRNHKEIFYIILKSSTSDPYLDSCRNDRQIRYRKRHSNNIKPLLSITNANPALSHPTEPTTHPTEPTTGPISSPTAALQFSTIGDHTSSYRTSVTEPTTFPMITPTMSVAPTAYHNPSYPFTTTYHHPVSHAYSYNILYNPNPFAMPMLPHASMRLSTSWMI